MIQVRSLTSFSDSIGSAYRMGLIYEIDEDLALEWISGGLVEAYSTGVTAAGVADFLQSRNAGLSIAANTDAVLIDACVSRGVPVRRVPGRRRTG